MDKNNCKMAEIKYCKKSAFGYCMAEENEIERCPYSELIDKIAKLVCEINEYRLEKDSISEI